MSETIDINVEVKDCTTLLKSLLEFQRNIRPVGKNSVNHFFNNSKYVDINKLLEKVLPELNKVDLLLVQEPGFNNGNVTLKTSIYHVNGESISSTAETCIVKKDPQAVCGAITYLRRYAIQSFLCLQAADDDGESTMDRGPAKEDVIAFLKVKNLLSKDIKDFVTANYRPKISALDLTGTEWTELKETI